MFQIISNYSNYCLIMANLNGKAVKQELKAKVSDLMQQYEKNKQDQLHYKQQMKQNIMLQIINNRNKLQQLPTSSKHLPENVSVTTHTNTSDPFIEEPIVVPPLNKSKIMKANQVEVVNSIHTLSIQRAKPQKKQQLQLENNQFTQITFKAKKNYQSLDEEGDYNNKQIEVANKSRAEDQQVDQNRSISTISKYAKKYQKFLAYKPSKQQYQEQLPIQVNPSLNSRSNYSQLKQKPASSYNKNLVELLKNEKNNESELKSKQSSCLLKQQQELESKYEQQKQPQGVFLTVQESESMVASQVPKNVAFQIKMDQAEDPQHLQNIKLQKIKQFQRKRQERIQQFRRNQSQKKVEMPRARNSSKKVDKQKTDRSQKEQVFQVPTPKSSAAQRKFNNSKPPIISNRLEKEKSQLIPLQQQQSQLQIRQNISKPCSQMLNNQEELRRPPLKPYDHMPNQQQPKPLSPFRTPKTVLADNRSKSSNKASNIFAGESVVRQKSGLKLQPKIQPKQRKNSFSRQSNKKLMVNAITHICFPGELNRKQREKLIEVLQSSEYQFFVFLFKEYSRKIIKGIYTLDNTQNRLERIYGDKAPFEITSNQVQQFYRFDSGSRQFKKVDGCRSFSLAIHAIDLK